jgi:hypothetical protein
MSVEDIQRVVDCVLSHIDRGVQTWNNPNSLADDARRFAADCFMGGCFGHLSVDNFYWIRGNLDENGVERVMLQLLGILAPPASLMVKWVPHNDRGDNYNTWVAQSPALGMNMHLLTRRQQSGYRVPSQLANAMAVVMVRATDRYVHVVAKKFQTNCQTNIMNIFLSEISSSVCVFTAYRFVFFSLDFILHVQSTQSGGCINSKKLVLDKFSTESGSTILTLDDNLFWDRVIPIALGQCRFIRELELIQHPNEAEQHEIDTNVRRGVVLRVYRYLMKENLTDPDIRKPERSSITVIILTPGCCLFW